ncbi:uncharacterized protein TM35_000016180 [Trypanosoma theileri]|uniref:Nucleoside phosphorylase domain-containing protein n=1 Tax=Trypanosoma theileri TaxID=67003 RepID=A0A1X0PA87_9TRYP|nr:uncharacterized protein TM35_000016180 [Trypanosoma theileri]ORC93741.1 hypothetical protein TM35_000016180 [Trypanosoma theileri]
MFARASLLLALGVFLSYLYVPSKPNESTSDVNITNKTQKVHMFLCADNGTYSGRHELHYIKDAMEDIRSVEIADCQTAFFGYLVKSTGERLPSLIVTTGIYVVSAAACTVNLMQDPRYEALSIVYLGTAGISPTVGGWNPNVVGGCGVLEKPNKNHLGSVCVTNAALLQECGICYEETVKSECSRPNCVRHNDTTFFGRCAYRHPTSLASMMREAMKGKEFPAPSSTVKEGMESFWKAHSAVEDRTPPATPQLLNCAETDTSQILAGARSDLLCREYSHDLLPDIPLEDHTCVQAMEGFGFLHVMSRYPHVPIALVRAGSNYNMYPMSIIGKDDDGTPIWSQNTTFMTEEEYNEYTRASYRYAVLTASTVVLNYFTGSPAVSVE